MRLRDKVPELLLVSLLGAVSLAAHAISLIGRDPKPMFNRPDDVAPDDLFKAGPDGPVVHNSEVPADAFSD